MLFLLECFLSLTRERLLIALTLLDRQITSVYSKDSVELLRYLIGERLVMIIDDFDFFKFSRPRERLNFIRLHRQTSCFLTTIVNYNIKSEKLFFFLALYIEINEFFRILPRMFLT